MPTVGPNRRPWRLSPEHSSSTAWGDVGAGFVVGAAIYVGVGAWLGLSTELLLGGFFLLVGVAFLLFGIDALYTKDVLPVGDYSPPDSAGAVLRVVGIAGGALVSFLMGVGFVLTGYALLT